MPSKNAIKQYVEDGIYHVYNRGVEKRIIFRSEADYAIFLKIIKNLLDPEERSQPNFSKDVEILAYCLMPNHFHLMLKQLTIDGMTKFIKSLSTRYSMYFNTKYERTGPLFQGSYKAVLIQTNEQLIHLSRYIHLNPQKLRRRFTVYPYSSYKYYSGEASSGWVKPNAVAELFDSSKEYEEFLESTTDSKSELGRAAID